MADANFNAAQGVAIREFPLATGYGFADYLPKARKYSVNP